MFEKLDFDLVQVDLQGAFGAACDAIRADMKCFCQALSIEPKEENEPLINTDAKRIRKNSSFT
jgi:hypothetical protein